MEQTTRLTEVLKRKKSFKRDMLEEEFYSNVTSLIETLEKRDINNNQKENPTFRDYQDTELKRRAMTISAAYNIAVKLLLSLRLTGTTETYFKNFSYSLDRDRLETINKEDFEDKINYDVMIRAIEEVDYLDRQFKALNLVRQNNIKLTPTDFLLKLSDLSVTLAWLEAWYKTGFFPKDFQIMQNSSAVQHGLAHEVFILLERTEENLSFILQNPEEFKGVEFDKQFYSQEYDIEGTASILIKKGTVLEIKTTGKDLEEINFAKDYEHLVGLNMINEELTDLILYYPRHESLVRVDLSE